LRLSLLLHRLVGLQRLANQRRRLAIFVGLVGQRQPRMSHRQERRLPIGVCYPSRDFDTTRSVEAADCSSTLPIHPASLPEVSQFLPDEMS